MPEKTQTFPTDAVAINLGDGKPRHLRYSLGSLRRLKAKFGATLLSAATLNALDEDKLTDLLFEGLVEKEDLTLEAMADLIDARRIPDLVRAFSEAFSGSFPEKNAPSQTATLQ
jgi:hypothetical protein